MAHSHACALSALRAIQKYDAIAHDPHARVLLVEAQDALGSYLGYVCSGVSEGDGHYAHDGDTCPVHEWAYPEDHDAAIGLAKTFPRGTTTK